MSYAPPGTFPGAAQQQLAQLAQQQQQQMQAQQAFQVQQSGLASLPKPQQDLLNSLTPQQIQSLLGQANSNLTQQSMNISSQFNPASQIPQLNQAPAISTVQPMPAQNMNAILSDMVNKAKAGLLTPLQLSQLRSILDQQQQSSAQTIPSQQPMTTSPKISTSGTPQNIYNAMTPTIQGLQMNQQMVMPGQNSPAPVTHSSMGTNLESGKVNQPNNVTQGVQFMRKIQLRISEIEQKLATAISDTDRKSLQRAHQELIRLQATLVQKISQGIQMPTTSGTSNMMPSVPPQNMTAFSPSNFANAATPKLGTNMLANQAGSVSQSQPSMPMPNVQTAQTPNVTLTPEQFKRTLSELMRRHGKSLSAPIVDGREVDLYHLFTTVQSLGGSKSVMQKNLWSSVCMALGFISVNPSQQASTVLQVAQVFKNYLELFEDVWNRAMLHQLSMGRGNPQMVNSNIRNEGTSMKPMVQSQAGQSRPSTYPVMQAQQASNPSTQQTPMRMTMPFTKEQLASLNLTPEQMALLLQQQAKSLAPTMSQNASQNGAGTQNWTASAKQTIPPAQTRITEPTKQQQGVSQSSEKQRWQPQKVTPKLLEDAESLIRKIELSLNISRPKLPVIESMTESEKTNVFQQVEKLIPLKTTVSALLPAFLAISGNVEPAKRVKIMVYMFEDQLALLPKRQCILRPSDLEKLKIQMTRCIGFVRMNDDKLAQRIMAKTLASQQKSAQRRFGSDDPKRSNAFTESNKKTKIDQQLKQGLTEANKLNIDSDKSRGTSQKPGEVVSPTKVSLGAPDLSKRTNNEAKSVMGAGSPEMDTTTSVDYATDVVDKTLKRMTIDHQRNTALAQNDPLLFVQKAWNELLSVEDSFAKQTSFMDNLPPMDDKPIGDRQLWMPSTIEAAVMKMIDAPSSAQSTESHASCNDMVSRDEGSIEVSPEGVLQNPLSNAARHISTTSQVLDLTKPLPSQDQPDRSVNNASTPMEADWWQAPLFISAS